MIINGEDVAPSFWGLKVSPENPQTVIVRHRLLINRATLGLSSDELIKNRSILSCKIADKPEVYLCSLRLKYREMSSLNQMFEGPNHIVFSVKGPLDIHISGYLYDDHAIPTQINQGVYVGGKDRPSCSHECETFENTTKLVPKPYISSPRLVLNMNVPTLINLPADSITNCKDKSINILLQGVTQAQIEAFSRSMNDKVKGAKSTIRKLDYLNENENGAREEQDASHETTTQAIVPIEECEIDVNRVKRSTRQTSQEYHVLWSKKNKRHKKRKENDEDENDQKRSEKHGSLQIVEAEIEADFEEAKKLKRKSKKLKQAEGVYNRALEDHTVDTVKAKKPKKMKEKEFVQEEVSSGRALLEDHPIDTMKAKKPKKRKEKEFVQEKVRSPEAAHGTVILALACPNKR
ncbi:peptidyl-prolyl cis-trans isomerase FKBP53-like [Beta vulgaris subsp. vulgaris]|nr:peptidyl-prolyl cis-trans isomerase FKBP53-like [Beta vulgaris subsp. vulgaris]